MAKRKNKTILSIGKNVENSTIQIGDTTTNIHNNIDGEELGQSLGESLSETARSERFWEMHRESLREDSRQVMETIFVSLVSGFAIGACWKFSSPWNIETVPFFVIGTTVLFNVLRVTNFGLRRSIFKVILISTALFLLLKHVLFIQAWMEINQFVGAAILAVIGAGIGLVIGLLQTFWKPLED